MGKVIINEQDATETARSESVKKSRPETGLVPVERTMAKFPRSLMVAKNVGANVNSEPKKTAKPEKKIEVSMTAAGVAKTAKPDSADKKTSSAKANAEKKPVTQVKILESTKVAHGSAKAAMEDTKAVHEPAKVAMDPELALMQSRSATAAKSRDDAVKLQKQMGGRVMSDMVRRPMVRQPQTTQAAANSSSNATASDSSNNAAPEEESTFAKMRSALIGVGVAVVVAVIGFVCIGIFGNNKSMCVVQFESNGGTQVEGTEIVCGRTVAKPEDPTKEGFTFQGWMQDGDLFDFEETPLYKNAILVARWQANEGTEVVKVTFDTDGGSTLEPIELAKGSKLTVSLAPTKPGYVFDDWYLGDKPFDFDQPVTEDITLKATWTKQQPIVNNNNSNNNANTNKPTVVKVASLSAGGMSIANVGDSASVNVTVLPSAAEYSLKVSSSNEGVASCSVSGNTVTCKANNYGTASVRVQDVNSGVMTTFNVVIDKPQVEPEPVDPQPPVEPQPVPKYNVTINYVDADGKTVATSYNAAVENGGNYAVTSPVVEGYVADKLDVSGKVDGMDVIVTVTYSPVTPQPDPPSEPSTTQ